MTGSNPSGLGVAVFDLDGTVTDCDTYLKFLGLCLRRRPRRLLYCLHLPLAALVHKIGLRDNAWLKSVFLKSLAGGCDAGTLEDLVSVHLDDILNNHLRPAALEQIERHRQQGHLLMLATASFDFYVEALANRLRFHSVVCTRAARGPDRSLVGAIDGDNCYGAAKLAAVLKALPDRSACTVVAYSDHHSDWGLLKASDRAVAVSPTAALRRLAHKEGIEIRNW